MLFLIGMRINAWWKPWDWLPVMRAMGRMLRELDADPELGLLGARGWLVRAPLIIQYWESVEKLQAYATAPEKDHIPAWRKFNQRLKAAKSVGIWHETYLVDPGQFEGVYVNMPPYGLGAVLARVEAAGPLATAHGRLAASSAPTETRKDA